MWEILDTGVGSAVANMQIDAELLEKAHERSVPVLHFYEWEGDCATYGYFTEPSEYLNLEGVDRRGLKLARRPTGGGIVFHVWDMAFSAVVPASRPEFSLNTLENYKLINRAVLGAIQEFIREHSSLDLTREDFAGMDRSCQHFCMAKPTKYDVILEGRKVAGAAQRKTKGGFLHQGTISLVMPPDDYLREVLKGDSRVLEAVKLYTFPLLGSHPSKGEIGEAKAVLKSLLATHLNQVSLEYSF
jgi:lipoate-protein ligase A